ncbi:hypothetical protein C8R44DRAFT_356023 [Mycena epipterygia]|nr:hypothetical protein C8R44DRAFT_356023 [Mycena epipterygia]
MSTSDPFLPPELEYYIFQIAALSDLKGIPNLLLVAQRVRIWLEPLIYRIVVFQNPLPGLRCFTSDDFHPATYTKSPSFFREHVRHLCVGRGDVTGIDLDIVLSTCSGVQNLFLFTLRSDVRPNLLALLSPMPLRRLCINLKRMFDSTAIDFSHAIFANITHLDVLDYSDSNDWTGLALLPCLTHLAFNDDDAELAVLQRILSDCASLQVFVLLCSPSLDELRALETDMRFMVLGGDPVHYREDWQRGVLGRTDYWDTAEAFIAKRRAGIMNPLCFDVDHVWDADIPAD